MGIKILSFRIALAIEELNGSHFEKSLANPIERSLMR
jgi:hypothetical protein